ncbi:glycosyltransferase family 4 protein [Lipingzhangella sp. LS1_29]|uniref:Glycosyltransferase family 4 protein n=1 Tax=Lipingzhangella rawalii TaxID=2055835 RepID=A0ABU2H7N9_9ACTN|nr:glycosyltransferase family 4 protein [Lipingzhangella rawalii]MDS1271315.1 glycosyltransferase family 4 protein [Lipingzhangella rawalii]
MRVGLVCPYTWDVPGGVQQHVHDLAQALRGFGHTVSILTPAEDTDGLPGHVVAAGRAIPVPYNGSVARLAFGPRAASRVRRWLRDGAFDVVHVHEPTAPSLSLLACWVAEEPLVATFHTANPRSRAMALSAAALRTAVERVHARIAVSEAARRTLVDHLGGDAVLIPNGVSVDDYASAAAHPRDRELGDGGTVGFLGRLDEPRKGLPVLIQAFRMLVQHRPELRLLLVGPGDATAALRDLTPAERERVVVRGQVTSAEKVDALASMDVFCAPNLGGESFGIVLAEAMAAGAPVVASDIPAFRAVLADGAAGALFPVGNETGLAQAVAALLDAPDRRAELAASALHAVRAYDWSTVAVDVLRVYETVTLRPAGSPGPGGFGPTGG